ncbi:MAG TPA: NAD-dependent succinate-semialdehyde dehydrogenase [Thermoplasmata archaeon]|nr:NAD-dependent succinate-semialdehyde dehydrogenase [Thermoplasmata archaeon]
MMATKRAKRARVPKARPGLVKVVNPTTGKVFETFPITTKDEVNATVDKARDAFKSWSRLDVEERAAYLQRFAQVLRKRKEEYGRTMSMEMGKIIRESIAEVDKCAWAAEYFAQNARPFLQPEVVQTDAQRSYIAFHPRGVLGSIMPWNFPMWQIVRFAIPALAAGNTAVIKPASASPMTGLRVEEAFQEAGLPDGVLQIVVGDYTTGAALIRSRVDFVSLTGSVSTGVKIAREAARDLKKTVLELGGSDPFIVCEDADLDQAAKGAIVGRFINNGQSCIAAKRFIVVDAVADEFLEKLEANIRKLKVGDPLDPTTDIGPLYAKSQRDEIEVQVKDALARGARLHVGGKRGKGAGWFYEPTLLSGVTTKMKVMRQETFGPVLPVFRVPNVDAAIAQANDTEFGLGASVWTRSLSLADEIAERINAGLFFVNNAVKSDPRMPFGGVKHSGVGRELSRYGLLEMVNIKTVMIYPPGSPTPQAQHVE